MSDFDFGSRAVLDFQEARRKADLQEADLCDCYFNKTKITFRGKTVEVNFTEVK